MNRRRRQRVRVNPRAPFPDQLAAASVLGLVKQRARQVRWARTVYRNAILEAVEELERQGAHDAYARVAEAAGVSRQSLRTLVGRARAGS